MTPAIRTLPIVRAMRVARGWFVALPAGNLFAESEAQVRSMVARHAPGSVVMFLGQNPQRDAAEVAAVRKIRLSRAAAVRDGAAAANSSIRLARVATDRFRKGSEDSRSLREGPASRSGRCSAGPSTQRANGTRTAPDGRSRTASPPRQLPGPAGRASRVEDAPPASSPRPARSAGQRSVPPGNAA